MRIDSVLRRAQSVGPHRVAVDFHGRNRTWRQLGDRIRLLGGALADSGVKPGDRVAVLAYNSDCYLELLYGVPWAGAIVVPINTRLAPAEINHWLQDSGASVVVVEPDFADVLADVLPELPDVRQVISLNDTELRSGWTRYEHWLGSAHPADAAPGTDADPAVIFYTGGTTGRSKGVTLSHRNVLSSALQTLTELRWDSTSVYLHAAPMFHMADGLGTYAALLAGGTQTMCARFDAEEVLRAIEASAVTCSVMVPTMIDLLLRDPTLADRDLRSLRCLAFGGSPMPEDTVRRARILIPDTDLYQIYGQSEASPTLTILRPEYHVFDGPLAGKTRSAGTPCIGCEVSIAGTNGELAPVGTVGEILGRGDNVMLGYWNNPELSAETLRNGWLHTGDAGYLDEDGFLFVVDRVKDMIVSGGENVYCAEVENALLLHPEITEAQVIGVPHPDWGESVHAIIRVREGGDLAESDVIAHCKQLIARYKCPKSVEIRTTPFPVTGAGKYMKSKLREPYWAQHSRRVN
ncbi:long-chain-fatty-acid--CoA ligase [Nocardia sp. NPDC052278]|uniref:long-chain-fatty-acid--CoA ligase n=1 Tax=unclassified Nocardia TaxID=2637762 RepID=UPI003693EA0F